MCRLYEVFVANTKREMKRQGLNQERLGERMGRRQSDVSNLLNRRKDVRLSTVELFAEALDVPPSKLMRIDPKAGTSKSQ
ncbi:helix-turn-helix domain-containing protein [Aeoliella mucimassa]|uniref:HTH cro/C1-type domain-containing protein n=1 Tax=Aeoliella mucimassa TaxID=2527972 RepID=A0A518AUC3_9BACT|nr:helix-turn-helix transcriptional regulator [Aeoliella mucimassa]QDU58323.1 hypothetical protein Pan181_45570 [Aeoliella mucimassa]